MAKFGSLFPRIATLLAFLACCPFVAQAAEWDAATSMSVSAYVTDNFCLSPGEEEDATVGTITPRTRITGRGGRAAMTLNGRIEFNSLREVNVDCPLGGQAGQRNNRESVVPSGTFFGEFEALENFVFLEANASAGLNPINPFGAGVDDSINGRQNANITYRWGGGLRAERVFDQRVSFFARYNYNEQVNSFNQAFGDSSEDQAQLQIDMVPGTSRLLFGAGGSYSEIDFEGSGNSGPFTSTLSSAEARATFVLDRRWQINASAGEEFNEFLSASDDIDGTYWDVGAQWSPNSRVSVNVGTGERFFGETPRANVSYRHKRSSLTANYARSLVFPRNLRAPDSSTIDSTGNLQDGLLPGDPVGVGDTPVLVGDSPILNENFSLRYAFNADRTSFYVTARDSKQTRAVDLGEGTFTSASISLRRTISPKLSASMQVGWRDSTGTGLNQGFSQEIEAWTGGLSLSRRLARRTSIALSYRYTDQESNIAQNTFEENRLTLTFNYRFD